MRVVWVLPSTCLRRAPDANCAVHGQRGAAFLATLGELCIVFLGAGKISVCSHCTWRSHVPGLFSARTYNAQFLSLSTKLFPQVCLCPLSSSSCYQSRCQNGFMFSALAHVPRLRQVGTAAPALYELECATTSTQVGKWVLRRQRCTSSSAQTTSTRVADSESDVPHIPV